MKVITIRDIPDDLYHLITRLAKRNHRSIQKQVIAILDRARILEIQSPSDKARAIRERLHTRDLGDTVKEIQQERNR
ncbi:MAG: hypothetical protein A2161_17610 [Candidatus Schekmanbacteria bacterium RBG_13_48_7]|uniref:Antitoxin FitA-like ribbon-helix-helix domain-containing protein n=1 Tax=Candidatus Schekmanbacteria bacterium RBG_13_48_7 TaxID=1817878 RepID=A0A1F7RZR9_9BACT|nr:MAG: hypothetical protein A2161_17610 [Candidatus Schekmanbacteria bacterium RBG_13_48_7]